MMQQQGGNVTIPRLPTAITSSITSFIPLCVPCEPSNVGGAAAAGAGGDAQPHCAPALLHAVCRALLAADTTGLHPRLPVQQLVTQAGTLEHGLVELNPHVFQVNAGPINNAAAGNDQQHNQVQHSSKAAKSKAANRQSAAAAANEEAHEEQAAKRRKTVEPGNEEYVARTVDTQQVAAEVAEEINSFISRAAALTNNEGGAAQQADDGNEAPAGSKRSRKSAGRANQPPRLELLKQLHSSLAAGKQAGILAQLDQEQLRQLLLLLLDHVRLGQDRLIEDQDTAGSESAQAVSTALEAACCCLQVLAAPSMHSSLYMDEVMTATVNLAKYQLQYNVLALHDPQYKRLYRPAAAAQDAAPATTGKRKVRESSGSRPPKVLADVRSKLELLLSLLAQAVERIVLEVELLLPLVRVGLTCLSVDSLQLLQGQAVALAAAVFRAYPQQRTSLADEVLTVVGNLQVSGSKAPSRLFEATGPGLEPLPVMMATALIAQLVQVSVELPEMDSDASTIQMGFRAAYGWSEYLWKGVFAKLPAAKAAKTEGATDFKVVVHALLADLLTVQMLPEWPAANILLRRFIKQLASDVGLKHKDAAVKLACVEFTGQLATGLSLELLAAEKEADEVQTLKEAAQAAADPSSMEDAADQLHQIPDLLLLDYLASSSGSNSNAGGSSTLSSARRFACCRMLHDAIHSDASAPVKEPQALALLLVQHRRLQDSQAPALGDSAACMQLKRSQVVKLLRQGGMRGPYGAARGALVKWLLETGSRSGPDPSPATVRTKVFKCLGAVVEADSRVMASPDVAAAVQAAQEDDSAAVKEAVLELLVKLINTNPQLAGEYFDTLLAASYDQGISVRKRAIRALWECCSCPGFSRATDAVLAVLKRANDKEDSMKSLVTKICGDMWFLEGSSFAGLAEGEAQPSSAAAVTRTAAVRAGELAALSLQLYEASGKTIHVPLAADHGLIVIFKEVLGTAGSSSAAAAPSAKELKEQLVLRQGAADMAEALLNMTLQHHQQETADDSLGSDSGGGGCFQYLLALHILTAADPSVAAPAADPQRFVRFLAPYTSALANTAAPAQLARMSSAGVSGAWSMEDSARRAAEEALCLLAVLEAVLSHLGCVEQDVAQQLANDLLTLLNKTRYLQLIAASCQLLCTLAALYAPAAAHVTQLANRVYSLASAALTSGQPGTLAATPRLLYVLGQLCRYGADIVDAAAAQDTNKRNCTECLELCVSLWYKQDLPDMPQQQRVREGALQSLGLIIIGRPGLMLQPLRLNSLDIQHSGGPGMTATSAHSRGSGDAGSPSDNGQHQQQQQQLLAQGSGVMNSLLFGANVVRVYTTALSDPQVPFSVKGRVLSSLVELLRAEESALLSRQREAEAASTASRLPSTLPQQDIKAPLARVNGEGDAAGGSGSSSIIQCVWQDVLRLATGVGGGSSGGSGAGRTTNGGLPPPTPLGAAGIMEAAATRRKSLELIEVVLRGGLVAPWDAVPPLVAQLTDELPETRAAALKVLKTASEKYSDFVANQLAPGVLEAFSFQSRLWAAKHPGQPLPKGPSPEVLEGLSAMYSDIIAATPGTRQRFLTALLKPFEAACNLAASPAAAAREDSSRLAFCAYVAANLPYKKADEPLVLLHAINGMISRLAQEARDVLRRALLRLGLRERMGLEEDEEEELANGAAAGTQSQQQQHHDQADPLAAGSLAHAHAADGAGGAAEQQQNQQQQQQQPQQVALPLAVPLPQWVAAPLKASMGLSMLLVLKQYLMAVFALSDERVAQYELKGDKARAEAKALVSRSKRTGEFSLSVVNLRAVQDGTGELLAEQYKTFAALLDNDAANYREAAVLAALADNADEDDGEGAAAAAGGAKHHHPSATPAGAAGLVVYSMDAKTRSTRGRGGAKGAASTGGRGSTGGRATTGRGGRGAGRAGSSRGGGKKAKPRRRRYSAADDSSADEAEAESGDEDWGSAKAAKARKLFD